MIFFIVYLYGLAVTVSGPLASVEFCEAQKHEFERTIDREWIRGNMPTIDGRMVTPRDIKTQCERHDLRPRTVFDK